MSKLPSFLKKEGDSILFNGEGELQFYVPENYFDRGFAEVKGEITLLIGVFDYTIVDKSGKNGGLKQFRLPTSFLSKPGGFESLKDVKLTKNSDSQDYRILKYSKGDVVIVSTRVPKSVANAEIFYNIYTSGKLPNTIKYDDIHNYFLENININGASYGCNMQLFGIVISEMSRKPDDVYTLYRHSNSNDLNAYKCISLKEVPKYVSPFTSVTSENWDESMMNAILNDGHTASPLETSFM